MDTDVIIMGKSIAGLVLSVQLQQLGICHVLLGRCAGKSDDLAHAETLPPSALPLLKNLDLLDIFSDTALRKTYGYHSLWGSERVSDQNFFFHRPYQYGLCINKQALLHRLEERQQEYVLDFEKNWQIQMNSNCVDVSVLQNGVARQFKGKLVVDATGRRRAVLDRLNIPSIDHDDLIAFSCHLPRVELPRLIHDTYIESFPSGWGIVSKLDEETNVLTLFTDKQNTSGLQQYENWPAVLDATINLRYFLTGNPNTKVKGRKANSSRPVCFCSDDWLAIGDAAISFDPLSSHGITNAVYTAHQAAGALASLLRKGDRSGLQSYDEALSAIYLQYVETRRQLYQQERRWPQEDFWKAQAIAVETSLLQPV